MGLIWVTEAEYIDEYKIRLCFNDGSWKIFDVSTMFGTNQIYEKIQDKKIFKLFSLDGWTISWLNHTVDIAPEYLYEKSIPC